MNVFIVYGAYVASKVFIQHFEDQGQDDEMIHALRFLYQMLQAFASTGKNASLYRAQLDLEFQKTFLDCGGHRASIRSVLWGGEVCWFIPWNFKSILI